jgi:acyl carrier protein
MTEEVKNQIKAFVNDNFGLDVANTDPLFSSSALNSLSVLQVISFIEKTYSFRVPVMEVSLDTFDSVDKISEFVAKMQG